MNKYSIEIKWAIIFCVMALTWMLMEKLTGLHSEHIDKHPFYSNFIAIPAITVYVLAFLDKRKNFYSGIMTYKQGFVCGVIITLIVAALNPITQFIVSTVISPEFFPNVTKYAVSQGLMTPEQAADYFNLKNYIIQGTIGALIMGLLTTAIVAIFTRRKANNG